MMPKNSALAEALAKAGVKGTKTLSEFEEEEARVEKEQERVREEERKRKVEIERQAHQAFLKRTEPFEKLWKESKSRGFMIYLLHAFLPFENISYLWEWPKGTVQRCCNFCRQELMTKTEAFTKSQELAEVSLKNMARELRGEIPNGAIEDYRTVFGNKVWATGAEGTTTLFCPSCAQNFTDWVQNKLLHEGGFGQFSKTVERIHKKHRQKLFEEKQKAEQANVAGSES